MYSTNWMAKWIEGGVKLLNLFEGNVDFWIIQCGAFGPATSTRIAFQIWLNIPVLGRGVNNCNVSPRIKDLRSQLCFLSLPPSITVVSEKDNLFNNNNKNFKYDSTEVSVWQLVLHLRCTYLSWLNCPKCSSVSYFWVSGPWWLPAVPGNRWIRIS